MPQTSFALLTNTGRAKEAAALANATTIEITHIAIGDGATVPSGGETQLYNEIARKTISGHGTVTGAENVAYFDCYLAAPDGPYTIREAGLYDSEGDLIAIAHYDPPINKPVPASGQTVEATVRLEVAFSNIATVVIKVDPAMLVALQRLTQLPWIAVLELGRNDPPAAPVPGDVYVIGGAPTGTWVGHAGKVAEYTIAGWALLAPRDGHGVGLPDGRVFERVGGVYVEKIALDVQSGKWLYAVAGGTANALTATLTPAPTALVAGMRARLKISAPNTDAMTLNVNGLGAKAIVRKDGSALAADSVIAGQILDVVYDGVAWQALDVVGGSGAYAIGGYVQITASTTYEPTVGCRAILVEGVGGGGAGGGASTPSAGRVWVGSGGGGGGYFRKLIVNPLPSYVVTIGAGGAAVSGSSGNSGGTTSFGAEASATGGEGGYSLHASTSVFSVPGGAGGVGSGGDIAFAGAIGGRGTQTTETGGYGGIGGDSYFGGGGVGSGSSANNGGRGTGFGAGGGGAVVQPGNSARLGGAGAPGAVLVQELF